MKSLPDQKTKKGLLSKITNELGSLEIVLLAIATSCIEFKAEGVLLQSLFSILSLVIVIGFSLNKTKLKKNIYLQNWIKNNGWTKLALVAFIYALVSYVVFDPTPAHAILFKAQTAITGGITASLGQENADLANSLNFIIVAFLWIIRLICLGYLAQQAIKIFNEREEENWIKLIKTPAIFIVTISVINVVATYITTGGAGAAP